MIHNLAADEQVMTSNAFLVEGDRPVVVDVGSQFDAVGELRTYTDSLDAIVLTHTHSDHVGNLDAVADAFDAPVWGFDPDYEGVDHAIDDGDVLTLGDHEYRALHTPGHKNDHVCLYAADPEILFAGDLVFAGGSFGRTDLEEGDRQTLIDSIDYVLETVSEDLRQLHVGHGPSVTENPYRHLQAAGQAARQR